MEGKNGLDAEEQGRGQVPLRPGGGGNGRPMRQLGKRNEWAQTPVSSQARRWGRGSLALRALRAQVPGPLGGPSGRSGEEGGSGR